jgi:flavin reductase
MALLDDFDFDFAAAPVVTADLADFKEGMRQLTAGVTIVTTAVGGARNGLTATAVCSLSAEPPMLLACVNREAGAHDPTLQSRVFCVNVLAEKHLDLATQFASSSRTAERFTTGNWGTLVTGAPVLMDALASFDCLLGQTLKAETHTVLVGRVQGVRSDATQEPLLYSRGKFGTFISEQG